MRLLPELALLQERYKYDPETGAITHRASGEPAFVSLNNEGYLRGKAAGERSPFYAHRIAWKLHYGREPGELDHINRNRSDNRIANLREVSHAENQRNRARSRNNSSGVTGVRWHSRDKCWCAWIGARDNLEFLGSFREKDMAIAAREAAERARGYQAT